MYKNCPAVRQVQVGEWSIRACILSSFPLTFRMMAVFSGLVQQCPRCWRCCVVVVRCGGGGGVVDKGKRLEDAHTQTGKGTRGLFFYRKNVIRLNFPHPLVRLFTDETAR